MLCYPGSFKDLVTALITFALGVVHAGSPSLGGRISLLTLVRNATNSTYPALRLRGLRIGGVGLAA